MVITEKQPKRQNLNKQFELKAGVNVDIVSFICGIIAIQSIQY